MRSVSSGLVTVFSVTFFSLVPVVGQMVLGHVSCPTKNIILPFLP